MPLDSTNWSQTETETKPDVFPWYRVLKLDKLILWLEGKPPETEYDPRNTRDCVIVRWARETGQPTGLIDPDCAAVCFVDIDGIQTYGEVLSRARALLAETRK